MMEISDRWKWFARNRGKMVQPSTGPDGFNGKFATVGTLSTYQEWLLGGVPASAAVGSVQVEQAWPCAVDWELLGSEGESTQWGGVEPSAGLGPSVFWGLASDTPVGAGVPGAVAEVLAGVYVEWSVNGIRSWQMCDACPRGTLVVGAADWVRVSFIACEESLEGGADVFVSYDYRLRFAVRPAEAAERSRAVVSHAGFVVPGATNAAVACWLGQRAKRYKVNVVALSGQLVAFGFLNLLLGPIVTYTLAAMNNAGGSQYGRPVQETQEFLLPAGAVFAVLRPNGATQVTYNWSSELP